MLGPLLTLRDQILILADESVEDSIVHSDSRSLATLLLIRDIQVISLPSSFVIPISFFLAVLYPHVPASFPPFFFYVFLVSFIVSISF